MLSLRTIIASVIALLISGFAANAQILNGYSTHRALDTDTVVILPWFDEELGSALCLPGDVADTIVIERQRPVRPLSLPHFRKPAFDTWLYLDSLPLLPRRRPVYVGDAYQWLDDLEAQHILLDRARQNFFVNSPDYVDYNLAWLPEDLDKFTQSVDASPTRIKVREQAVKDTRRELESEFLDVNYKNWIQNFDASVQFSQAYVSPNWYQGGSNSLIMLINAVYNVKLNQKFHPNLLFESTVSYKLGTNSTPDDSVRSYNVSEDIFQINSTFGYKAFQRWYYSVSMQFKTQLFNSYKANSQQMQAAFLSPGELNVALGMTYDFTNPKKTFSCKASIAPFSWQLNTCINNNIDETNYDIKPGRNCVNQFGSTIDANMTWKLTYNITYTSRLFAFSDYTNFQGDWEHTLAFRINRFLTTQIYAHMRYDTSTPRCDDPSWHKFQFKEVLSFGFSYRFANL